MIFKITQYLDRPGNVSVLIDLISISQSLYLAAC